MLSVLYMNVAKGVDMPIADVEEMDGNRVAVYVEEHALSTYPAWEPGKGTVPISVTQVISAVETWVKKYNPSYGKVVFNELVLKQVRSHNNKLYWYYLVSYREALEDGSFSP